MRHNSSGGNLFKTNKLQKWSKKLYIKTNLPDNYVDESFLTSKRTNDNAIYYTYWSTVNYTGLILNQLSS
jgi:hypothetical protein